MAYFKIPLDTSGLKKLSANELVVLYWLINWCRLSDHKGICTLSAPDISDRIPCDISVPTLRRVITKLVSLGYISVRYTKGCNWCISIANLDQNGRGSPSKMDADLDQNDQTTLIKMISVTDQNDQGRVINLIRDSDQNDHPHYIKESKERIKESKKAPPSNSSDLITPSAEDIKAAEEAMKRHGLL